MGGDGHNLLPFEWAFYCFYGVLSTGGAVVARLVRTVMMKEWTTK
jgi:hypothetical protein